MLHFGSTVTSMSTSTHAKPGNTSDGTPRVRLISGPLALVFLSSFGTLTSFYLLLSVTPMYAAAAGAGSAEAGLVTGVLLLGTVAAELAASSLMNSFGYRKVLVAGAVLLGIPALALLSPGSLVTIVAVSVVRGLGFGLGTVAAGALVAALLPPERRGEGIGLATVVELGPAVVALPSGVWLAGHFGFGVVIGVTAATALLPLAVLPWLPGPAGLRGTAPDAGAGRRSGCWPASGLMASCGWPSSSRPARWRPAWSSPSFRSPPGYPAMSPPPACSRRPWPPRSAAGGPGAMATGMVTRAC